MHKIATATRKGVEAAGGTYEPHPAEAVVEKMIEIGRPSRLKGAGFYEYVDGNRTQLWPGLRETFNSGTSQQPLQDMIDRMLFAEALGDPEVLRRGRDHLDRGRQHRLDLRHRFPRGPVEPRSSSPGTPAAGRPSGPLQGTGGALRRPVQPAGVAAAVTAARNAIAAASELEVAAIAFRCPTRTRT